MFGNPSKIETEFISVIVGSYNILHFYPFVWVCYNGLPIKDGALALRDRRPGPITSTIGIYGDGQG